MTISFILEYHTQWGESLEACIALQTEQGEHRCCLPLTTTDGQFWRGELTLNNNVKALEYTYRVMKDGALQRQEWSVMPHRLDELPQTNHLVMQDNWRDRPQKSFLLSSAFTQVYAPRVQSAVTLPDGGQRLTLRVFAPNVPEGQVLCALGNQPALGIWQQGWEQPLTYIGQGLWQWSIDLALCQGPVEYKYLLLDAATREQRGWEMRENRMLHVPAVDRDTHWVRDDEPIHLPVSLWRGAGTVIPVFSLRTEKSFGVGDFGDIKAMVDWLQLTGQHVLQLLPINDTTQMGRWTDSYPYNAISIYALHPIYACLHALPSLQDEAQRERFEALQRELNTLAQVDYERVMEAKREYLWLTFQQEGERVQRTAKYKRFLDERRQWLMPYAAFCTLRDRYQTAYPPQWGEMAVYNEALPATLMRDRKTALQMRFHIYVQYVLHTQLTEASQYARAHGVALKGDIPIGISRNSVEAWVEPELFHMDSQAGAPPDAFSVNGQNWGFPTYNWERMLQDDCQWWRSRFQTMAQYFDAYRIDHVLGFFRIWSIPQHSVHGLLGQFQPAKPLSVSEIEQFGLQWDEQQMTQPVITDAILLALFANRAPQVRHMYLESMGGGRYMLKPEVQTQRQVEALFLQGVEGMDNMMRDGLYSLISNVLFVEDTLRPRHYHPRIAAQDDHAYAMLSESQRHAFNALYEDFYYHRHSHFWYKQAMQKLPLLCDATRMLVCAEDLGMVPESVPWALGKLDILSLEIQSMPKNPCYAFGHLWENPYASVATISTHDMPTLRQWWNEDWTRTQRYFNEALYRQGPAPHPLPEWLAETIVSRHLESPSMFCLLSFQDWMSIDGELRLKDDSRERINVPANPRNYWRYRMHMSVEQLMQADGLNQHIYRLIKEAGR